MLGGGPVQVYRGILRTPRHNRVLLPVPDCSGEKHGSLLGYRLAPTAAQGCNGR